MKLLFYGLSLLFTLNTFAQADNQIKWGPEYPIGKKVKSPNPIGWADGRFFVLRNDYKKNYLESYTTNTLELENSFLIPESQNGIDLTFLSYFIFNDKPYFIHAGVDGSGKKVNYYVQSFSTAELKPSELKLIASRDYEGKKPKPIGGGLQALAGFYGSDLLLFRDEGHFLIGLNLSTLSYYQKSLADVPKKNYAFFGLNQEDEITSELNFTYPDNNFSIDQTLILSATELVFIGTENVLEVTGQREVLTPEKIVLIKSNLETGEQIRKEVVLDGEQLPESYGIFWISNDQILLSGLTNNGEGATGIFYQVYSNNLEQMESKVETFDAEFIKNALNKKALNEGKSHVLEDYYLSQILVDDYDNVFAIAEQFSYSTSTEGGITYRFGNLIVIKFDKNGNLAWKKVVKKNQVSTNDSGRYSSFFAYTKKGELRLIFNEREGKMVENYDGFEPSNKNWGRVFGNMVIVNADGSTKKEKIFEFPKKRFMRILPGSCERIDDDTILLYARSKQASQLGILKI